MDQDKSGGLPYFDGLLVAFQCSLIRNVRYLFIHGTMAPLDLRSGELPGQRSRLELSLLPT